MAFDEEFLTVPLSGLEQSPDSAEESHNFPNDDAQNDALSVELPPSPALSMLAKLVAGLTADERAALARMLGQSEGG